MPKQEFLTPHDVSKSLGITYRRTLELLSAKAIKAEKVKGRWQISNTDMNAFKAKNRREIEKLKAEYVGRYWEGLNPNQLEKHVCEDFRKRGIVAKKDGFATNAIMDSLPKRKDAAT